MNVVNRFLVERLGVFRTWGSLVRVGVWVVVWAVVVSAVVAPHTPVFTDRDHDADVPPSAVRYVGPISRRDFAGFLPPPDEPGTFRLAWIGGSEVKLREVSVPGAFSQRVTSVGGERLVVDSYNLIAPRPIDVLRAIDTAAGTGVDAIVVSLNPAWTRSEWSMRDWANLDVSNLGTLWSRRSTWAWAAALTAPADYAWRLSRAIVPIVEAQTRLNARATDALDHLDVLNRPDADATGDAGAPGGDPRLPGDTSAFWLVHEHGPGVLADEDARVAALMAGIGVPQDEAEFFAHHLVDAVAGTGVPAYLYAEPFSAESLAKPEFAAQAAAVTAYWSAVTAGIDDPLVTLDPQPWPDPPPGLFLNNVHMADAGPFADVLAARLCAQWAAADPELECS